MRMLKIRAAASYACCSKRYVERVLANGGKQVVFTPDGFKEFLIQRDEAGRIDAEILRKLVGARVKEPYRPGRRITTRYRLKGAPGVKEVRKKGESWRLERALTLISGIGDCESLMIIGRAAIERAGHRADQVLPRP
jgi:hypothetical protein